MLVRQKMMFSIVAVCMLILVLATTAYTLTARRMLSDYTLPGTATLFYGLLQTEISTAHTDLPHIQSMMNQLVRHVRIRELALYNPQGERIAHSLRDESIPQLLPLLKQLPADLAVDAFPLEKDGEKLTLVITEQDDLPEYFYLNIFTTTLLITAISVLMIFLLYALVRRWQQRPYQSLLDTIHQTVETNSDALIRLQTRDPDLQPLTDTLNDLFWVRNQRTMHLQTAHRLAESARKRATRLSSETRQVNESLAREVSIRRSVETQLKHTQDLLDSILNAMPTGLFALDINNRVVQCNQQAGEWLDMDHHQLTGMQISRLIPELEEQGLLPPPDEEEPVLSRAERLPLPSVNEHLITDVLAYPLPPGQMARLVIRIDDVSQRQRMEEIMVQTEKMMTVGGLAAGMAHEINNPLGAILQNLQNIRRRLQPDMPANQRVADNLQLSLESLHQYLTEREVLRFFDHIQDAGERAAAIVANMLQFARNDHSQKRSIRLEELLEETFTIAASDLSLGDISTDIDPQDKQRSIRCVPSEIQQVLLNLLRNAGQALDDMPQSHVAEILLSVQFTADQVIFRVSDNGPGIPADVAAHIFEPFFTTKEVGEGTGLGLSVSYFIVTSHHQGQMVYRPGPGGVGACFEVRLPLLTV
ncbi:MAG: hypothetical protein CMI00_15950 [Oceanospirillaceae bacterium]|nr:hypothetical protein [Oceanospirillaceae bacterium]